MAQETTLDAFNRALEALDPNREDTGLCVLAGVVGYLRDNPEAADLPDDLLIREAADANWEGDLPGKVVEYIDWVCGPEGSS